jgi:hypothetical protein
MKPLRVSSTCVLNRLWVPIFPRHLFGDIPKQSTLLRAWMLTESRESLTGFVTIRGLVTDPGTEFVSGLLQSVNRVYQRWSNQRVQPT